MCFKKTKFKFYKSKNEVKKCENKIPTVETELYRGRWIEIGNELVPLLELLPDHQRVSDVFP